MLPENLVDKEFNSCATELSV